MRCRRDLEVLPAASVASTTYEKVPRSQTPDEVFPVQLCRCAGRLGAAHEDRTTVVLV